MLGAGSAQRDSVDTASAKARTTPLHLFGKSHGWLKLQVVATACLTLWVLVLAHRGGSLGGRISTLLVLSLPLAWHALTQIPYSIMNL